LSYIAATAPCARILPLISTLFGTVWTVGFMSIAGTPVLITIVAPPLILIFGNEYNIFTPASTCAWPGRSRRAGLDRARDRNVASPIAMAVLTTVIGFLSSSPPPSVRPRVRRGRELRVPGLRFLALFFLPAMYALLAPVVRSHRPGGAVERPCAGGGVQLPPSRRGAGHPRACVLFAVTFRLLTSTRTCQLLSQGDPVLRT